MRIMRKLILVLFVLLTFASITNAQGKLGLGIIVGEPTGISGKMKVSEDNAFDGAVGWSFNKYGALHIHADYLYNVVKIGQDFPLYVGVGGRIKLSSGTDDSRLGARVPIGIVYQPSSKPFDLFIETVPMLDIVPSSEFNWNAAAGVRYYFK
jgi:hypothetical protein